MPGVMSKVARSRQIHQPHTSRSASTEPARTARAFACINHLPNVSIVRLSLLMSNGAEEPGSCLAFRLQFDRVFHEYQVADHALAIDLSTQRTAGDL